MAKKSFNSLGEMLCVIEQEQKSVLSLQKNLGIMCFDRLRKFFSMDSSEREQFKLKTIAMKGKIESKKDSVEELEEHLDELCTFDFDLAMNFIAHALSTIEGEDYAVINLDLSDNNLSLATGVRKFRTRRENVTLISTTENVKMIAEMEADGALRDGWDVESAIDNDKYILVDSDEAYTLYDYCGGKVPDELTETYTYLSPVVMDLVSLRLANPDLPGDEVASAMLDDMPNRYSNLIETCKVKRK